MDFFTVGFVVGLDVVMCSFCWLASKELTRIANCSVLYLHSNDMNSLKCLLLKKRSYSYK